MAATSPPSVPAPPGAQPGAAGGRLAARLAAQLAARAAAAGLDLAVAWQWRFGGVPADAWDVAIAAAQGRPPAAAPPPPPAGPEAATAGALSEAAPGTEAWADAWRVLAAGLDAAPGALLRLERDGEGAARPVLLWLSDGAPLARALGRPAADGRPAVPAREETLAEAARLCDGVAMRLGLGRGVVRIEPPLALLPLQRRGGVWTADAPPPPVPPAGGAALPGAAARRAAAAAAAARPALVAALEGARLVAALPPLERFDDHLELLFALDDAAAAAGPPVMLDGPPPPPEPRLRRASAAPRSGGLGLALSAGPWPRASGAVETALWRAASLAGPPRAASLAIGDADGAAPGGALAARPEIAARAVADWLGRPGLATALGPRRGPGPAAAGDRAAALDLALRAASLGGASAAARGRGLAAALDGAPLRYGMRRGAAYLRWTALAAPQDPREAAAVEALAVALLVGAALRSGVAGAPAAPAGRGPLTPGLAWPGLLDAVAELDAPGVADDLSRGFAARFPGLGVVEAADLRLTLRVASEAAQGARAVEAAIEGAGASACGLWVQGRPAPLLRCSGTGRLAARVAWQAEPDPHGPAAAVETAGRIDFVVAPAEGGAPILSATLAPAGEAGVLPVLTRVAPGPPMPPWRPERWTLDLRLPPAPPDRFS